MLVQEATCRELINELRRRSLACCIVLVRAEDEPDGLAGDAWLTSMKGTPVLIGAMTAIIDLQIKDHLSQFGEPGSDLVKMRVF